MSKSKKAIRKSFNTGRECEIDFSPRIPSDNTKLLLEAISFHLKKSDCENCNWVFAVVGFNNLGIVKDFEKPCLLIIHMELIFARQVIKVLEKDLGFIENTEYKPEFIDLVGALIIYCEPKP